MHEPNSATEELLRHTLAELQLGLSDLQFRQLAIHFDLLLQWNQRMSLTSLRRPEEIAKRHFAESLFLAKILTPQPGLLVDVGAGAGFPGLPLTVAWPFLEAVLLEPNRKKLAFLKEVVRRCGLQGIQVRAARLEETAEADWTGQATLVTMRAVRPQALLPALSALLANNGHLALYVGEQDASKLASSPLLQWESPQPVPHSERRVILIGKHL